MSRHPDAKVVLGASPSPLTCTKCARRDAAQPTAQGIRGKRSPPTVPSHFLSFWFQATNDWNPLWNPFLNSSKIQTVSLAETKASDGALRSLQRGPSTTTGRCVFGNGGGGYGHTTGAEDQGRRGW